VRHAAALASAVLLQALVPAALRAQEQEREAWDPFAGMDPNGRIERPPLPEDLAHPERWRYVPPGRIAPGNVLERFLVSSFISPVFFREKDIGTGGGFALTDIDFRNQGYRELANILVTYTSEGQQAYSIDWQRWLHVRRLPNGGVLREERSSIFGGAGYTKTLTRRFFGFGSETRAEDETSYTEERAQAGAGVWLSVPDPGDSLLFVAGMRLQHHELARGRVSGVPSTEQVFPATVADGDDVDQLWLDLGIAWDSRDSLHQPYHGSRVGLTTRTAAFQTGGMLGGTVAFDAQTVVPLPPFLHEGGDAREENPPTDVLALGLVVADTHGDLPFYSLPSLGGTNTLRGYIQNRFTDRAVAAGSLEYRFSLIPRGFDVTGPIRIERVGLTLFYDLGTVADGIEHLDDGRYLDSVGLGVRVGFSREATFRIDYGHSDEGGNLTISFGNAF